MTPPLVAGIAASAVALLVGARPRVPSRATGPGGPHDHPRPAHAFRRVVRSVGRTTLRIAGRRPSGDATELWTGAAVLLVVLGVAVDPAPAALVAAGALLVSRARRLRRTPAGTHASVVITELPELADLLALTIGAGLTVPASLDVVAVNGPPALRAELAQVSGAISAGARVETAITGLSERWGRPSQPLVHALVDHLRYGTPVVPALDRVAADARAHRRRAAEARARRLPVLLLFPLVLCTLPAFGLLTVAPLVAGTLGSLDGSPLEAPASPNP